MSDHSFIFQNRPDSTRSPQSSTTPAPLSVTDLTRKIKRLLETQLVDIFVEGEISGFKAAASGHLYFDLKDAGAVLRCVMWSSDAGRLKFKPDNGAMVELRGRLTVYEQRGQYQLTVSSMRPAGLGRLYQAFLDMKDRLAREGLFDPEHKKPIPPHPVSIGLVTSPTGAAIQDMLNILTRRAPHIHIFIWPARVQGEGAAAEIAQAIRKFNSFHERVDVIIAGRGGGSLEDLWAFNEEVVARAIFDSEIPIISAVGHETDTTIADFVADLRAPTPSAAAELVARDSADILRHLQVLQSRAMRALRDQASFLSMTPHLTSRMENAMLPRLDSFRAQVRQFESSYGIQLPLQRVNQARQHHDTLLEQTSRILQDRLRNDKLRFSHLQSQLQNLNPKAILKRGYSITYDSKSRKIIHAASQAPPGTSMRIIFGEGEVPAQVIGDNTTSPPPRRKTRKKTDSVIEWFGDSIDDAEN